MLFLRIFFFLPMCPISGPMLLIDPQPGVMRRAYNAAVTSLLGTPRTCDESGVWHGVRSQHRKLMREYGIPTFDELMVKQMAQLAGMKLRTTAAPAARFVTVRAWRTPGGATRIPAPHTLLEMAAVEVGGAQWRHEAVSRDAWKKAIKKYTRYPGWVAPWWRNATNPELVSEDELPAI